MLPATRPTNRASPLAPAAQPVDYRHGVRVLVCAGCGASLEVAIGGGDARCGYCGAVTRFDRRVEEAERPPAPAMSESERIDRLRAQDRQPLRRPDSVAGYLLGERISPGLVKPALDDWLRTREQVTQGGGFDAGDRLFHLTLLLAAALEPRRERALLESAVEVLPDARHGQVLRGLLARGAALERDQKAAELWLRPCNPRSTDLLMDTAYRIGEAYHAVASGHPQRALELLGQRPDDVPLADEYDAEAALLRADAIEQAFGPAGAAEQLEAFVRVDIRRLGAIAGARERAMKPGRLRLCAESWTLLPAWREVSFALRKGARTTARNATMVAVLPFVLLAFGLIMVAALWDSPESAPVVVGGLIMLGGVVLGWIATSSARRARRLAARGRLCFAEIVSVETYGVSKNDSMEVYQQMKMLVEGHPEAVTVRLERSNAPPLGSYPVLADPDDPTICRFHFDW